MSAGKSAAREGLARPKARTIMIGNIRFMAVLLIRESGKTDERNP
jgi:hypothetical protein